SPRRPVGPSLFPYTTLFRSGRMVVDGTLRSVSHPEVYGIGDAAALHDQNGHELRMACATRLPTAHVVAESTAARLAGRTPEPLRSEEHTSELQSRSDLVCRP